MKWVIYFILLANVLFFSTRIRDLEPPPPAPIPVELSLADHTSRLQLLSEVNPAELRVRAIPTEQPPDTGTAPAQTKLNCYRLGPIGADGQTIRLKNWLEERGMKVRLHTDERRELTRYWVFLPPRNSRTDAIALVTRLRGKGLRDLLVVPRGDMTNAISLGVYNRRASVDRRIKQLQRRGYEPQVTPRYRTVKAAWMDVSFAAGFDFPVAAFASLFPEIEAAPASCPAVS